MPSPDQAMFINLYSRFKSKKSGEQGFNGVTACTLIGPQVTPFKLRYVSSMVLTFTYFYPRNEIMFIPKELTNTETLERVAVEWGHMNWVRTGIWLVGLVCCFLAWDRYMGLQDFSRNVKL